MNEIWKPLLDISCDYSVSNLGRVKSKKNRCVRSGGLLKQSKNKDGFMVVNLYHHGKAKTYYVHSLIAKAFLGKSDLCVHHLNGKKDDNRVENLEYASLEELSRAANLGSKSSGSKLIESQVREIKKLLATGELTQRTIASIYGVKEGAISKIKLGITWSYIEVES